MDNDEGLSQGRTDNDGHEMTKIRLPENDYIVKSQNVLSFLKDFIPFNGAATMMMYFTTNEQFVTRRIIA